MTKIIKRSLLLLATILCCLQASAEYIPTKIYAFGFGYTFNDSTVYITDIMELDSAWVERKLQFLYSRENYSSQLKEFLNYEGVKNPTCIISYAKTRKDIDKKYNKLIKKCSKPGKAFTITKITESVFKFDVISAADDYAAIHRETKAEKKERKANEKAARKELKAKVKEKKALAKEKMAAIKAKRKAEKADEKKAKKQK